MTAQFPSKDDSRLLDIYPEARSSQGTIDKIARAFRNCILDSSYRRDDCKSVGVVFGKTFSAFGSCRRVLSFSASSAIFAVHLDQFLTGSGRLQRFIENGDIVSGVIRSIISHSSVA